MADMLLGGIVINEILADPNSSGSGGMNYDTDGNGTADNQDEYVELYNASNSDIDISGLQLWDKGLGNWFTFPPGTTLKAGAHALVLNAVQSGGSLPTSANPDDLFFDAMKGGPLINNSGDNVVLYDPANDEFIQATFNGQPYHDPTTQYTGFSPTATQSGVGENFGNDIDGYSMQREGDGNNTFLNNSTQTPGTQNICFTGGTLFDTPGGPVPIEALNPGDLLLTKDNGPQPIRWIWARKQPLAAIRANPALNAIRIGKNALGKNIPRRDMFVSRHHRIMLVSAITERMYGKREILVPAKDLVGMTGISVAPLVGNITYYHILMENHEVVFAEGAPAESLYLGAEAVNAIEPRAGEELRNIFGEDWDDFIETPPRPACTLAKGTKVRSLVKRHVKNNKHLLERNIQAA
jgi:hypothetical protein